LIATEAECQETSDPGKRDLLEVPCMKIDKSVDRHGRRIQEWAGDRSAKGEGYNMLVRLRTGVL
jgi:hypothetical protein